ncbi:hypothetical protein LCGC14_2360290, partial [marine sediment metagenome]
MTTCEQCGAPGPGLRRQAGLTGPVALCRDCDPTGAGDASPPGQLTKPGHGGVPGPLRAALEIARDLAAQDIRERTRTEYGKAWAAFARYAGAWELRHLPASPATVAAYLGQLESDGASLSTATVVIAAIRRAHLLAGHPDPSKHPLIARIRDGLRNSHRRDKPNARRAVTWAEIGAMVDALSPLMGGIRDRAVLTVAMASGCRRAELVAFDVDDVTAEGGELVLHVRGGKTGDRFVGLPLRKDVSLCPVRSLTAWTRAAGLTLGPLFRSVDRHGTVRDRRLSGRDVGRIIQRAAARAQLPDHQRIGAHSMRRGCVTELRRHGAQL